MYLFQQTKKAFRINEKPFFIVKGLYNYAPNTSFILEPKSAGESTT